MNTDLASRAISAEQLSAPVVAWKAGAMSREKQAHKKARAAAKA